jgi:uncharacterized OB-fold protein
MTDKHYVQVQTILPPMPCQWSVGPFMERFYLDLAKKKITGVKCKKCGTVYVPPRAFCSECNQKLKKFVGVKASGEVTNYTVAYQNVNGSRREKPILIALIKLDGADTEVFGELRDVPPGELAIGLRVKAVFAEPPGVTVAAISHFAPAGKK